MCYPLKFKIVCSEEIVFPDNFNDLIPKNFTGEVLNYGQGEGQVQIGNTVWGFYYGLENGIIQFEEGTVNWETFIKITNAIKVNLEMIMNSPIMLVLEGAFNNEWEEIEGQRKSLKNTKSWWKFW